MSLQFLRPRRWAPIPRAQAHRLLLAMPDLSARQLGAAVGLQVGRLCGAGKWGYCWRRTDDAQVEVWYWDEAGSILSAKGGADADARPACPENLLREVPPDGFSLTRCSNGMEATFCRKGRIEKTRWFASTPSEVDWSWFVQDAGRDPVDSPMPRLRDAAAVVRPSADWTFFSSLRKPMPRAVLVGILGLTALGATAVVAGVYDLKLDRALESARAQRSALATEAASAVKLQKELDEITERVSGLSAQQAPVLQLQALARLANSGLLGDGPKVYLTEWEFRNDRIRMQFAVPQENFALSEFLADIEKIGAFSGVRLLPGTPGLAVGLQASLRPVPSISEFAPIPEAATPVSAASASLSKGRP